MVRIIRKIFRHIKPVRKSGTANIVEVKSRFRKSSIDVCGNNNVVKIGGRCILNNLRIFISGDNNRLIIEDTARLLGGCRIIMDGNATVHIGKNAGIREVDFLAKDAKIEIGELCMFSNGIIIRTHDSHKIIDPETKKVLNNPKDVILGKHVWIGQNVTILKGVNIGDDSVLAIGSIVTKSCASNSIMAGNPAKVVKEGIEWDY